MFWYTHFWRKIYHPSPLFFIICIQYPSYWSQIYGGPELIVLESLKQLMYHWCIIDVSMMLLIIGDSLIQLAFNWDKSSFTIWHRNFGFEFFIIYPMPLSASNFFQSSQRLVLERQEYYKCWLAMFSIFYWWRWKIILIEMNTNLLLGGAAAQFHIYQYSLVLPQTV